MGFGAFHPAVAAIAGMNAAHIIHKGPTPANRATVFQTFAARAA